MSPHVDGAAAAAAAAASTSAESQLLHRDNKPRWKCGEIYTWNSMDSYAVECALCDDKNLCTLTEFATHMQIWHRSWECASNSEGDSDEAPNSEEDEDEIEMAAATVAQDSASENEKESQDDEEIVTTDTETDGPFTEDEEELAREEQESSAAGESTVPAQEEEAEEEEGQTLLQSIWNLPTNEIDVSDIAATADCIADVTLHGSPDQLKIVCVLICFCFTHHHIVIIIIAIFVVVVVAVNAVLLLISIELFYFVDNFCCFCYFYSVTKLWQVKICRRNHLRKCSSLMWGRRQNRRLSLIN